MPESHKFELQSNILDRSYPTPQLCILPEQVHRAIVEINESSYDASFDTTSRATTSRIMCMFDLMEHVKNQFQSSDSSRPIILNSVLDDAGELNCLFNFDSQCAPSVSLSYFVMGCDRNALLEVDSSIYDPADDDQFKCELDCESNLNKDNPDLMALYLGGESAHIQYSSLIARLDTMNDSNKTSLIENSQTEANRIALAGFFYSNGGAFMCYACNASVAHIVDIEHVWLGHQPTCAHVLRSRGTGFVRDTLLVTNRNTEMGRPNQQLPSGRVELSFLDSIIFKKHFRGM